MDKGTKTIVSVVVALVVIGLIYTTARKSANGPGSGEVAGETYKVGALAPLTGDAAAYGEPLSNLLRIAVEEINSAGGIEGKRLELIVEDAKCNGKDGANAVQKLINVDKVAVVIGGFCSSESLAAVPIAAAAKVALLSPGSSSPDLTNSSPYFSRNYPSDASQGTILGQAAYNQRGYRKVAVIQEQLDYPLGIFKTFDAAFQGLGGQIVKEEFAKDVTDFRSQLTKLRGENPDALFIDTQTPAAAERILKQLQDMGWKPALIINDATAGDPTTLENNKVALEGTLTAQFGTNPDNEKFQHMIEMYQQRHGDEPPYQSYAQTMYDAVYMVRDAIAAVGYDGEKIAQWLRLVKDWDGASGQITIGPDGDRVGGHQLQIIRNGKTGPFTN